MTKYRKLNYNIIALIICALFCIIANLSVYNDALTSDEVSHIPAGYYYLNTGRYFINPEHPPLAKDIAALPLLFMDVTIPEIAGDYTDDTLAEPIYPYNNDIVFDKSNELHNGQWHWGRILLFHPDNNPELITFWARFSIIFFNSLILLILYLSLKQFWSQRPALLALFLITVSQFSLAHASLVTLDFMPSILAVIGYIWLASYLRNWTDKQAYFKEYVLTILFFSLALLTKFSMIVVIPFAFIAGLIFVLAKNKSIKDAFKFLGQYILLGSTVVIIIGAFYMPHVWNMEKDAMLQQVQNSYPDHLPSIGLDVMTSLVKTNNPFFQGITEYGVGVVMVMSRIDDAWQTIYFMGDVYGSEGAGLLYFPLLYLTKLSLGFIVLLFIMLGLLIKNKIQSKKIFNLKKLILSNLSWALFILIIFYAYITLTSSFQIGLRHIMSIILSVFILTAKAVDNFWELKIYKNFKFKLLFFGLAGLMIISTAINFPSYLEFYNVLGGSTNDGYKIATDSNYDWAGQGMKLLGKWAEKNNIKEIYTDIFTNVPQKYYLGSGQMDYNIVDDELPKSGSYIVVSINEYQNNIYNKNLTEQQKYTIFYDYFVEKVGKTMLVFRIP